MFNWLKYFFNEPRTNVGDRRERLEGRVEFLYMLRSKRHFILMLEQKRNYSEVWRAMELFISLHAIDVILLLACMLFHNESKPVNKQ